MSKIEDIISNMESYLDECTTSLFSKNEIKVDRSIMEDFLSELREVIPGEIVKYQRFLNNRDAIINDAKEQARQILDAAQIQTEELINEHEIMQRAYAQANEYIEQASVHAQQILDSAIEDANSIREGAVEYTDDILSQVQYIVEHSIKENKAHYNSLLTSMENVLSVVENNRKELRLEPEDDSEDTPDDAAVAEESDTHDTNESDSEDIFDTQEQ